MKQQWAQTFVRILEEGQEADGSFFSYSVPVGSKFGADAKRYQTTFAPALILGALSGTHSPELDRLRGRATDWLLAQRGETWSFNYWGRKSAEAESRPYPDDWDDTSCSIIALTQARPELVTGEVMGHIVTILTNTEMAEGGPYRTWIVSADSAEHWQDVDLAVNANIAYMLRLHGVDLPHLEQLAEQRIDAGPLSSPYYPSEYPVEYFVSRWYQGALRDQLRERILDRQNDWGNPLNTALAVSASLNLGAKPETLALAVERLRALSDKAIRPYALCIDPAIEGQSHVAGSRALTAAFCLEAITKYDEAVRAGQESSADEPSVPAAAPADGPGSRIGAEVVKRAMARLAQGGDEIHEAARRMQDRLLNGTAATQITLLPYLFRRALGEHGRGISDERLVALGMISFYGWLAYTVYDDFLDEEGEPPLLPVANLALRELVLALNREAAQSRELGPMIWEILDRQEAANAWEVRHCRVRRQGDLVRLQPPEFEGLRVLAERSMGHALGCLAITMELGYAADSSQVRALRAFFHHFLIARQLSDDVQDWKMDLQKGQINAVGAHLLRSTDRRGATVRRLYLQLEQYFWAQGVTEVNGWILREISLARAALAEADFVQRPALLEALVAPIEEATHQTQNQQQQTAAFLRTYHPELPV